MNTVELEYYSGAVVTQEKPLAGKLKWCICHSGPVDAPFDGVETYLTNLESNADLAVEPRSSRFNTPEYSMSIEQNTKSDQYCTKEVDIEILVQGA